jgi:hypothetical protein
MADNRLYVANLETRQVVGIAKGYGPNWDMNEQGVENFKKMLDTTYCDTPHDSLVLFTERSQFYDLIMRLRFYRLDGEEYSYKAFTESHILKYLNENPEFMRRINEQGKQAQTD